MSQPSPEQVPQAPVGDVGAHIEAFLSMLAGRGIADEDDAGPVHDEGRL